MNENPTLVDIIKTSTFRVIDGLWLYAKVASAPNIEDCFLISKDDDEITVAFEESKKDKMDILETNKDARRLIEVRVSAPFYAVGFLAAITGAISKKGCNNLVVSTYSKDYVLVTDEQFDRAREALLELGFTEEKS